MTSRYLMLSHLLHSDAPVWPGNPPAAELERFESIERGDIANTTRLRLFTHSGTHVDTPRHFNPDGPAGWQLPIEAYVFHAPRLIDVPKPGGGFIELDELKAHAAAISDADLMLIRTGWGALREAEPGRYVSEGPLLEPSAAAWLIDPIPASGRSPPTASRSARRHNSRRRSRPTMR